jgi:hypothetical protein
VEEQEFWRRLEVRVCAEFGGLADRRLRHYWCDGLIPEEYDLAGPEPRIRGVAWCGPSGQEPWRFTLEAGRAAGADNRINWPVLLPGDGMTGWLIPDPRAKTLQINPLRRLSTSCG